MGIVFRYVRDEILNFYCGITDKTIGGILSILILLAFVLFIAYAVKNVIDIRKMDKERKASIRKVDKMWLEMLKGKDKNKEQKNY